MATKPVIVISNDDGVHAPALKLMREALSVWSTVYTVVPDRNQSGTSRSLTLHYPIYANWINPYWVSVQGTPADSVHVALTGLIKAPVDLVISGINIGPNLGDDVLYSGTVAAAFEASSCGVPAMAFSLTSKQANHYDTAVAYMNKLAKKILEQPLSTDMILNVNVPDLPQEKIQGVRTTCLGRRESSSPTEPYITPRGQASFWIGQPGKPILTDKSCDFSAVAAGYISVTPLQIDLTHHKARGELDAWL